MEREKLSKGYTDGIFEGVIRLVIVLMFMATIISIAQHESNKNEAIYNQCTTSCRGFTAIGEGKISENTRMCINGCNIMYVRLRGIE